MFAANSRVGCAHQPESVGTAHPTTAENRPVTTPDREPKRRSWEPSRRDLWVYHRVRFLGDTQADVASGERIDQSTVSRVVQRVERWRAHAGPRPDGELDPAERLRVQKWLTYERNELMLASALRIARNVEGVIESSKYIYHRQAGEGEKCAQSTHASYDRTGQVARFLRLAFRINMEQLKLCQEDEPPPPGPLSAEEVAEEERQAAGAAEEFERVQKQVEKGMREAQAEMAREQAERGEVGCPASLEPVEEIQPEEAAEASRVGCAHQSEPTESSEGCALQGETEDGGHSPPYESPAMQPVHNLHNPEAAEIAVNASQPCTCGADEQVEKICGEECITARSVPPERRIADPPDRKFRADPAHTNRNGKRGKCEAEKSGAKSVAGPP